MPCERLLRNMFAWSPALGMVRKVAICTAIFSLQDQLPRLRGSQSTCISPIKHGMSLWIRQTRVGIIRRCFCVLKTAVLRMQRHRFSCSPVTGLSNQSRSTTSFCPGVYTYPHSIWKCTDEGLFSPLLSIYIPSSHCNFKRRQASAEGTRCLPHQRL